MGRNAAFFGAIVIIGMTSIHGPARAQASETSCAQNLTQQLRRFNQQCIGDLLIYTASQPQGSATIFSEKDKYYVKLSKADGGLQAEAVSKQNYPLMRDETAAGLKALGWMPPDVEFGGFKKSFGEQEIRSGAAAENVAKALQAYGMMPGEAISLTVGDPK